MRLSKQIIYTVISSAFALYATVGYSQRIPKQSSIEALPRIAVDTIESSSINGSLVVLYSNNTWEYIHQDTTLINKSSVYSDNWDTSHIFSYKSIELTDLPENIEIKLIDNMDEFSPPTVGKVFSKYGIRRRAHHNGVDVPLKVGEPLKSIFDGKVRYAQYNSGGYGYLVIVRHANGLESWYAHLTKLNVNVNDNVKAGQIIGFSGNTGRSRGPHLHFELRYCDQTFDPEFLIDFETGTLKYQTFVLERSFFNIRSRATDILEDEEDEYYVNEVLYAQAIDSAAIQKAISTNGKSQAVIAAKEGTQYHTVRSGDILGRIATKYGVSIEQICRLNNISRTTILRINQRLRIR